MLFESMNEHQVKIWEGNNEEKQLEIKYKGHQGDSSDQKELVLASVLQNTNIFIFKEKSQMKNSSSPREDQLDFFDESLTNDTPSLKII